MRLNRTARPLPTWPVRMVHLGPGAFFRAHPAWCTWVAGDGWGIAAVGRSDRSVQALREQDGLYTVMVRKPDGAAVAVAGAVSSTGTGLDLRDRAIGVVTLTITEAGYRPGSPAIARLARALGERGGAPVAVVSCDNVAGNGRAVEAAVRAASPGIDLSSVTFPSTVVDRITPAATAADRAEVALAVGLDDEAAVVTEASLEWVIEDAFPAGRPAWEVAGARLVADVAPWSSRKLRILNAGHSLLAYAGGARGHRYVHEAVADAQLRERLDGLWAEAVASLPDEAAALVDGSYLAGVLRRWADPSLPHALAQIAADGSAKLAERIAPTVWQAPGGAPEAAGVIAAWVAHLRGATPFPPVDADPAVGEVVGAPSEPEAVRRAERLIGL